MRAHFSFFTARGFSVAAGVLAGALALSGTSGNKKFTVHDKAYYADPAVVEYVQPGLTITVVSAKLATDGTISVDYKLTDPNGALLDQSGVVTPGPVTLSFLVAYIPSGQAQFTSYITRVATAVSGGATATQAASDSGGMTQTVATGEYVYTYKTHAPTGFDPTATHRVGIYGARNLTEWDLGTSYANITYDWVPAGNSAPAPRDIVRTPDCNACHSSLAAHGGSRRTVDLCIMCHQPQTSDPNTGNSLDMKVFIHQIHMGSSLPSVKAGTSYQILGFENSVNDFSTVVYPADVRRCQTCHNPNNGAAQTNAWLTTPSRAACGSCHDDVNFATGANHVNLPQVNDNEARAATFRRASFPLTPRSSARTRSPIRRLGYPG